MIIEKDKVKKLSSSIDIARCCFFDGGNLQVIDVKDQRFTIEPWD